MVAEAEKLDEMAYTSITELVRIARGASAVAVERAKNIVKATQLLGLDGTSPTAEEIGRQLISIGRRIPPAEMWARVDAITPADVRRVATEFCTDCASKLAVAAMGPINNLPENNLLSGFTRPRIL